MHYSTCMSHTKSSNASCGHTVLPLKLRNSSPVNSHSHILPYHLGMTTHRKHNPSVVAWRTPHRKHVSRVRLRVDWSVSSTKSGADDVENTAPSIVACWAVFTELLPGNALIRSVIIYFHGVTLN
jgi:hypothetical protein